MCEKNEGDILWGKIEQNHIFKKIMRYGILWVIEWTCGEIDFFQSNRKVCLGQERVSILIEKPDLFAHEVTCLTKECVL